MRICLVSCEYPPETGGGGIGTQTYLKAHGLSRRGHSVHVVSSTRKSRSRTYQDGQATIHRIAQPDVPGYGFELSSYWLAYSAAVAEALYQLQHHQQFDLIHFPEYGGEGFVYQTDTFAQPRPRFAVQAHGPLAMLAENMGWPAVGSTTYQIGCFLERTAIGHCDLMLASSHNTARFCAERYLYPLDRIGVVHSGIDTDIYRPAPEPRARKKSPAPPRLLFVGKFSTIKGFQLTIEAVLRLARRYPGIHLRLIGRGDAGHISETHERIAAANVDANIEFVGYVPYLKLPRHYAWCDMLVGPSPFEGGPGNIYLEAMACGKPVIACNTGGTPEVVLDQQTGLLIPPNDATALETAIARLIDDPALRQTLGSAGSAWIAQHFSIDRYVDKVEQHYLRLLDTAPALASAV